MTGHNFGAGSSREAAVWGMLANNIRVIVARSFADIYRENCLQNGLLPIVLGAAARRRIRGARVVAVNGAAPFTVDLPTQRITGPDGPDIAFDLPAADRMRLLEGLDDIGLTLKHRDEIVGWEEAHGGGAAMAAGRRARSTASTVLRGALDVAEHDRHEEKSSEAIMAGKRLVLMPGAYDALSARIIEAEGFEAMVAGGYAGVGSMLAQADMGQSNMRDYADHYGRICAAVEIPVYVDADTGFGGVNNVRQMVRAFEAAGVAGLFISDQVFPNRCGYLPGKQIVPVEQMLAKIKAALDARRDPRPVHRGAHRCRRRRRRRSGHRALPAVHGGRRRHGEAHGRRHHRGDQAGAARGRRPAHGDAVAGGGPEGAQPRGAGGGRRLLRDLPLGRAVRGGEGVRNVLRLLKRDNSLAPCQEHSSRSTTITTWSA